jgi:formylglycine-generating enzyme required for sulfatase activity
MFGNVWEWVEDCYANTYEGLPHTAAAHGGMDPGCRRRVIRGGGWESYPRMLRASYRQWARPFASFDNLGFRVAADLE